MTFDEAERAVISGRYGEVLQEAVLRIASAEQEQRRSDLVRWLLLATQATRLIGRTGEALSHAFRALETAQALDDRDPRPGPPGPGGRVQERS